MPIADSSADAAPVDAVLPHHIQLQHPPKGTFDTSDLQWHSRLVTVGVNKGATVQEVYIPADRLEDFIDGLSLEGRTSFSIARTETPNQPGSLSRPQTNSYLTQCTCSCGPQDFSSVVPVALTQERPTGSRVSSKARGNSRKRGCLAQFKVSKLYCWPDIAQLSIHHAEHTNAAGKAAHGDGITEEGVRFQYAPSLSQEIKSWVCKMLQSGAHTSQIIKDHFKASLPKIQAGTADRDCFLTAQDVRNLNNKLAEQCWKLHDNEAQSVRLFYQQHAVSVFI
ncbi:TPA: hypothetical protein ACH3X1_013209 [Trebouxia sp. C0004]